MRRLILLFPVLPCSRCSSAGCGGESSAGAESEIAFVTSRDGDYAIYGMRADGSGEGRLSPEPESDDVRRTPAQAFFQVEPAWSPDGAQIAFASRRDGRSHVYVMSADGSGTKQLTSGKHQDTAPAWSPDGTADRLRARRQARLMTPDRRRAPCVTNESRRRGGGARLVARRQVDRVSRRQPGFTSREIWRGARRRHRAAPVTKLNAASYGPAWSPDGKRIVFSSNASDHRYQIYEIGIDGKGLRRLTFQPGEYFDPSWSVDGKTLMFERDGVVYTLVLGSPENALTDGPNDGSPTWRPVVPASR